jgi:signal transduction histidine kinase
MNETRIADMISKIAHELRSPLTSVKGFSSMLVGKWDRFSDEQRLQFVQTIHADAERMGRIVSEVLDLARMEAGRLQLHPVPTPLHEIVQRAVQRMKELPGHERVEVSVPQELLAWADPERMEAVVANLIENAIKFSDKGRIAVEGRSGDDGMATLTISDEGVGIDPARLEHVFAGPQPGPSAAATPSGTGLGLYLSRGLVEAHGGSITVDSQVDRGSVFTLTIPLGRPSHG